MKIIDIQTFHNQVPLHTPFKTAVRTVNEISDVVVKVVTDTGHIGYGEAAATAVITGETSESIMSVIHHWIRPQLVGMEISEFEALMIKLHRSVVRNTSAKAAVDMALYDLRAQLYDIPLYQLLGGYRKELQTDLTISLNDEHKMVTDSVFAVQQGYTILKVKVGETIERDYARIVAIAKEVGPDVTLRIDANQAWTPKDAVRIIRRLEDADISMELVEQPVHYQDIQGLKYVTDRTYTSILADESVFSVVDAMTIIQNRIADFINIKLMKTGGIHEALKICGIAESYGVNCMIGCMLESKCSVSAAAHLAGGKSIITFVDLDGPSLCKEDPFEGGPLFHNGSIVLNDTPGIGIIQFKSEEGVVR